MVCTDAKVADRTYGNEMAEKIHMRIDKISSADTVEMMIQCHIGRCHPLINNRKGQYAVDLVHPYRLVFAKSITLDALKIPISLNCSKFSVGISLSLDQLSAFFSS